MTQLLVSSAEMIASAFSIVLLFCTINHAAAQTVPLSGAIRLYRNGTYSQSFTSGRVQIFGVGSFNSTSNRWGNICRFSSFGQTEADVVCHQLTFSGASSYSYAQRDSFGPDTFATMFQDVSCTNDNYLMLFQCSVSTTISSSCITNENDISVTCYTTRIWDDPYNGMVRLSQGDYVNTGLIEVYCKKQWGTVCDNTFGTGEATAVCRQLGYSSYYRYDHLTYVGGTEQPIWLNDMHCGSGERCLSTCQRCPGSEVTSCVHVEDITITCYSPTTSGSSNTIGICKYNNNAVILGATFGTLGGIILIIIIIVLILKDKEKKGEIHLRDGYKRWKAKAKARWTKLKNSCKRTRRPQNNNQRRNQANNNAQAWQPPPPAQAPSQPPPPPQAAPSQPPPPSSVPRAVPPPYSTDFAYPPQYPPVGAYPSYPPAPPPVQDDDGTKKGEPPAYSSEWAYPPPS